MATAFRRASRIASATPHPTSLLARLRPFPTAHNFVINAVARGAQAALPKRLVMLRPNSRDAAADQLFLDQIPIPREAWSYEARRRILTWDGAFGGGDLQLSPDGLGVSGNIGSPRAVQAVTGSTRVEFDCDVAPDCGVTYQSSGGQMIGMQWDPDSAVWQNDATWQKGKNRLKLVYLLNPGSRFEPASMSFEFRDTAASDDSWSVDSDGAEYALVPGKGKRGEAIFILSFRSTDHPPAKSVYPSWMMAHEDLLFSTIDGALQIDLDGGKHELWGLRGEAASPMALGYYRTSAAAAPFGVFDGALVIDGKRAGRSRVAGTLLSWSDLDPEHQKRTGLPASGSLRLEGAGAGAAQAVAAQRLTSADAIAAIAAHSDLHGAVHQQNVALRQSLGAGGLRIQTLAKIAMYDNDNRDVVQTAVSKDLALIKQSKIPPDLWKLLFPNQQQPPLTGRLAEIAATAVDGDKTDPTTWYQSLATASLTSGLADGDEENCKFMNGLRAAAWLKTEMANSKIYYHHSQLLFQHEWKQTFDFFQAFLDDQAKGGPQSESDIDYVVAGWVAEIQKTIDKDAQAKLIERVKAIGAHAKAQKLYWAFMYYNRVTTATSLGHIKYLVDSPDDGSALTRLLQQHMAVLTALDREGYFAKEFTARLNEYLTFNILTTQFDFSGAPEDFDIIKQYILRFAADNVTNGDADIQAAAKKLKEVFESGQVDPLLRNSLAMLAGYARESKSSWAFHDIMKKFDTYLQEEGPQFMKDWDIHVTRGFGTLIVGGLVGLNIFSLMSSFLRYNHLTAAQKVQVDLLAAEFGLRLVFGAIKQGVRFYAMFDRAEFAEAACQHLREIAETLWKGEGVFLERGLSKIGNSFARWCGDVEGSVGKFTMYTRWVPENVEYGTFAIDFAEVEERELTTAQKIFGKNFDEFMSTRIGPVFILAGIGLSIYFMVQGESGAALGSDIANIIGGSLAIFADVGGWAIPALAEYLASIDVITAETAEGIASIVSTMVSWAGPLAVVAALVGIGLMLYEMFRHKPTPVEQFVNDYVKKAGFWVPSKASSIDYARPFQNLDQDKMMMVGASLYPTHASVAARRLSCKPDGSIAVAAKDAKAGLPDSVWQVTTELSGDSMIGTIVVRDTKEGPVGLFLSLMSDNTISFQPQMTAQATTIVTQAWRCVAAPGALAKLTSDGNYLTSLSLTLQPVRPGNKGMPDEWLTCRDDKIAISKTASMPSDNVAVFDLRMSGMAPSGMAMGDLSFVSQTKVDASTFGPIFTVPPSTPLTWSCDGTLPPFLKFHEETGKITVDTTITTAPMEKREYALRAENKLGTGQAKFQVSVA